MSALTLEILASAKNYFPSAFDGVIRIEIEGEDHSLWVDGRQDPPIISPSAPPNLDKSFCLWRGKFDVFKRIFALEERRLESSFIAGRLKISGDMSVMARLEPARRG